MPQAAFAAVDWGTTSFRLWLMDTGGAVLAQSRSREGMTSAMHIGFANVLATHLASVGAPALLPVIVCGMAGARQGWVEAGYVDVPAPLRRLPDRAVRVADASADIRILPGLAQRDGAAPDVMRGEETQLLGALSATDLAGGRLVCLPGTHCKWVRAERRRDGEAFVHGFSTFMTGELFDVVSSHSILSHTVAAAASFDGGHPAFRAAVADARANPAMATNRLFAVRSGQLLHGFSATEAKARLSGTLIGLEIAGARSMSGKEGADEVLLIASGSLGELYAAAFETLAIHFATIDAEEAVRRGLSTAAAAIWHSET